MHKQPCTKCAAERAYGSATASESMIRARLYPVSAGVEVWRPAAPRETDAAILLRHASRTIVNRRYLLLDRVGAGGTATVYRAQDVVSGSEVALKVLHDGLASDETIAERFRREASTVESLQHKSIVRAFEHGVSDGTHYIAMELVAGRSLKAIIADEAPLDPARAVDITLQILDATLFIHDHCVIHRDLKPGNVLVDPHGRIKVTDFGIARTVASDLTEAGSLIGTVEYLSPERLMGKPATQASDLYSVGIILYELLTGSVPFRGELVSTVALRHIRERPVPPARLNRAITPELSTIAMRALEKSPQARFVDARGFIAALRREAHWPEVASARLRAA